PSLTPSGPAPTGAGRCGTVGDSPFNMIHPSMRSSAKKAARAGSRECDPVLQRLGERVRNLRAARGMSRKALAQDAGVSERFLSDLETGVGNASILLLNKLAEALALPLTDILGEPDVQRADLTLSIQLLSSLSDEKLEAARKLLQAHFM